MYSNRIEGGDVIKFYYIMCRVLLSSGENPEKYVCPYSLVEFEENNFEMRHFAPSFKWNNFKFLTYFQTDMLQSFVENEIAKKLEKERMKSDRMRRKDGLKKRTLEEEMDEDTKIEETRLSN